MSNRTKMKGIPDGIRSLPQMLALFEIVRSCRRIPALVARRPIVLGLVVPPGQTECYGHVAGLIVDKSRYKFGAEAQVVSVRDFDPRRPARYHDEIAVALRESERVVVVVETQDHLPAGFRIGADAIVDLKGPSARDVTVAARILFGVRLSDDDAAFLSSVPLDDLAAAFRKGRPLSISMRIVRECVAQRAKKKEDGPTLDDLHGLGEAGEWGRELAVDLADWKAGRIPWEDVERGILLSGPPGTGKTTFAAALARTCGVDVVLASHARWQATGHLGDTLKAMRKSFDDAREKAPCILFVDEVDSIGDRDTMTGDWANYGREIVNAFLDCLDGAEGREGVVVVGACNAPERLDAAAKRPGRLDRHVVIPLPDAPARVGILRWHTKGGLPDDQLLEVAERTEGFSGAALEQLVRQARRAARRSRRDMTLGDLLEELPAPVPVPAASLWRSAVHEAGHAVVGLALGNWEVVSAAVSSVVSSAVGSQQAGSVIFADEAIRQSSADDYKARIVRALGGLAAEEAVFGYRTDGGGGIEGSDLYTATVAAAAMEVSLGLGGSLAMLTTVEHERLLQLVQYDHVTRARVEKTLSACFDRAKEIARERRADIERLAHALKDRGKLNGAEVREIVDGQPRLQLVSQAS
jgi:ATP-dependent Zn protease